MVKPPPELDPTLERELAKWLYNDCWRLLELTDRTPAQDDELMHQAHASRWHWGRVGTVVNLARGEWMCARVYSVLGRPEQALWHAHRCLALLEDATDRDDWDLAGAYEELARANAVAGKHAEARRWLEMAREAVKTIAEDADRGPIEADLATIPL